MRPRPGRVGFYATTVALLVGCLAAAGVLGRRGLGDGGWVRAAELLGCAVLLVAAYLLLAVVMVARRGDPD